MSAGYDRIAIEILIGANDVPQCVRNRTNIELSQLLSESLGPRRFAKWRRGYFSKVDLVGFNLRRVLGDESECLLNPGVAKSSINAI